jgi:hypothetical protein
MNHDHRTLPICPLCNLPVLAGEDSIPFQLDNEEPPATQAQRTCLLKEAIEIFEM